MPIFFFLDDTIVKEYVDGVMAFARRYETSLMHENSRVAAAMAIPFRQGRGAGKPAFLMMEHRQSFAIY